MCVCIALGVDWTGCRLPARRSPENAEHGPPPGPTQPQGIGNTGLHAALLANDDYLGLQLSGSVPPG